MKSPMTVLASAVVVLLLVAACGGSDAIETAIQQEPEPTVAATIATTVAVATTEPVAAPTASTEPAEQSSDVASDTAAAVTPIETFMVEVWADNWMAFYVNGELVAEDSVAITTERSFNAEVFTFQASRPFTIAIEAKDFKETDSGIEYIGERNQQMGDGGLIAQVTASETGEVVAVTNNTWSALVVHRAPLNPSCEKDADPDTTCQFEITATPADWTTEAFDDRTWAAATEWSAAAVSPKDGYDQIGWVPSAQLIWGSDLEIDNTVLLRRTVGAS